MQVIPKRTLREFWLRHPAAEPALKLWHARVARTRWAKPGDVRAQFEATVELVTDSRAIFEVDGTRYRLVATIDYTVGLVLIRFVGLRAEYDLIDARTI